MAWDELVRQSGASRGDEQVGPVSRTDNRTNLLIAEYAAIRALVAQKAAASHALVGAYLTVVAVVLGLVLANGADSRLLLVLPVLSAVSGVTILRRRRDREAANAYVLEVLKPIAAECAGDERMFTWEEHYARHRAGRSLLYELGLQLIFPLSGLACLIVTFPHLESATDWLTWIAGAGLLVMLLVVYAGQNRARLVARVAVGFRPLGRAALRRWRARRAGGGGPGR